MPQLIRLPNGSWLSANQINSVRVNADPPGILVGFGQNCWESVPCKDLEHAKDMAADLAGAVNDIYDREWEDWDDGFNDDPVGEGGYN